VEVRVSSGGERYEAHEVTEDMYASIDKVLDKLERQIRGNKGAAQSKKRRAKVNLKSARPVEGSREEAKPARSTSKVSAKATAKPGKAATKGKKKR
jgi:putative sigma-54 modulation protein